MSLTGAKNRILLARFPPMHAGWLATSGGGGVPLTVHYHLDANAVLLVIGVADAAGIGARVARAELGQSQEGIFGLSVDVESTSWRLASVGEVVVLQKLALFEPRKLEGNSVGLGRNC